VAVQITLRLPDGTSAAVSPAEAWRLQQLLWELGLAPGAAAAAGKLLDTTSSWLPARPPHVNFNAREAVAVGAAANGWITWTNGNDTSA
jgi:hypothetical protein